MPTLPPRLAALSYSHYATQALVAHPEDGDWLADACTTPFDWATAEAALASVVAGGDAAGLARALRRLRRRVYLHSMLRDLDGAASLDEVCGNMTRLAGTAIDAAVTLHHRALAAAHGEPRDESGTAQQLVVIGMGKLGGGELNVSSDIDLVFVYPSDGGTDGQRALANREFFDRLGRRVIGALDDVTEDGFVFRVDMRLRPYGESGPLTVPFAALEEYLDHAGTHMGALRVAQGPAADRCPSCRGGRAHHAVRVPQVPRFRRLRGSARRASADSCPRKAARLRGRRQARAGRNSRDRVHCAGAPAGARRPRARAARARDAAGAGRHRRARPSAGNDHGRAAARLCLPARRRAPAAVPRRPADAEDPVRSRRAGRAGARRGIRWSAGVRRRARTSTQGRRRAVRRALRRSRKRRERRRCRWQGIQCEPRCAGGALARRRRAGQRERNAGGARLRRSGSPRRRPCACANRRPLRSASGTVPPAHRRAGARPSRRRGANQGRRRRCAGDLRAPPQPAGVGEPKKRLPRAPHRASAGAAAARAARGRVRMGRRLPDAASDAAGRAARRARAARGTGLGRVAARACRTDGEPLPAIRSGRWTRCGISSMRTRSGCSRRISPASSPSSVSPITCPRSPTLSSRRRFPKCWTQVGGTRTARIRRSSR